MDCNAGSGWAAARESDTSGVLPDSPAGQGDRHVPGDATLCLNCPVRASCVGGTAAVAGTKQLRAVLAGRRHLRAGETVHWQGEAFVSLYAVRAGGLKSLASRDGGQRLLGLHCPGEVVGFDGLAEGAHASTLVAVEDTELCALRFRAGSGDASARTYAGRLWDMMSRDLLRERGQSARLAGLGPEQRVAAFLVELSQRLRAPGSPSHILHLHLAPAELAGYLGVPRDTVLRTLAAFERRGLLETGRDRIHIVDPELLQREARLQGALVQDVIPGSTRDPRGA